jgi:hypothetical protein
MTRSRAALFLAALGGFVPAIAAPLAITPPSPHSLDTVRVLVPSAGTFVYALDRTRVKLASPVNGVNQIQVAMAFGAALSPPPPAYTTDVMLGDLPEGAYHVDVVVQGTQPVATLGSVDFTVTARTDDRMRSNLTDLWWNPLESGWGLNIIDHPSGKLFATWFVYDAASRPSWYVAPDISCNGPINCSGDLYRTSGPMVGDSFDPAAVQRSKVGRVFMQYSSFGGLPNGEREGVDVTFTLDADPSHPISNHVVRQPF